eukprot:IDg3971t1
MACFEWDYSAEWVNRGRGSVPTALACARPVWRVQGVRTRCTRILEMYERRGAHFIATFVRCCNISQDDLHFLFVRFRGKTISLCECVPCLEEVCFFLEALDLARCTLDMLFVYARNAGDTLVHQSVFRAHQREWRYSKPVCIMYQLRAAST